MPDTPLDINEQPNAFVNADEALADIVEAEINDISVDTPQVVNRLATVVKEKFEAASRARDDHEERWLDAYHNYRGIYGKGVKFREHEKSRVFIKATKTKVLAAYGQLVDVVFGGNKFPLSIKETPIPDGAAEFAHLSPSKEEPLPSAENLDVLRTMEEPSIPKRHELDVGFMGDGNELAPGARLGMSEEEMFLGGFKSEFSLEEGNVPLEAGPAKQGEPQIKPAAMAAINMEKLIHDQIAESNGSRELRSALFECSLLGTGVIKGPFTYEKTLHKWVRVEDEDGNFLGREYAPERVKVPRIEFCSIWDFFPDPQANSISEAEYVVQRHKLNRSQIRALKDRPYFDREALDRVLSDGPNYVAKDFESEIRAENVSDTSIQERFEVLEYWGVIDKNIVKDSVVLPTTISELEEVQVNVWVIGGQVVRVIINPFKPSRIPYLAFSYEANPYSFFGVGVAENMDDSQQMMNGHARMAVDNLALAGSMVLDVDESALEPGQDYTIYPGKVFKRAGGLPGQSVYGIKFPNTAPENMQMFDKFRQLADESTGIPSYAHGQTGVMSTTRTAAGMSMLMGAASLNIKTVIKNIDDFLLKPLGEAYFQWNMAFYKGKLTIEGDMEIIAEGTSSLMQKEVRSQRIITFLQAIQNPAIAPFVKIPTLIKEFAKSLELDPAEFINDQDTAQIYAQIIGAQNPQAMLGNQMAMADLTGAGGGQVGVGGVPQPGEQQFSGNPEGQQGASIPPELAALFQGGT